MTGVDREWLGGSFVMVHLDLVDALDGSYAAAALLSRIAFRAGADGWWTATRDQMRADTRLSINVLRRAITELRDAGMIETERVSRFDSTLRWRVVWEEQTEDEVSTPEVVDTTIAARVDITIPQVVDSTIPSLENYQEPHKTLPVAFAPGSEEQLPMLMSVPASAPTDALADEFAAFWSAWPDKRDRKAAEKAYRAARRRGVSAEVIAAGAASHAPAFRAKMAAGERAFIPHAATWLNKERWNDPPPSMPRVNADAEALRRMMAGQPAAPSSPLVEQARAMMGLPTRHEELA